MASQESHVLAADRALRLHVTRETEYGDRFKLFVIPPLENAKATQLSLSDRAGLTLEAESDSRLNVSNTVFNGLAETAGVTFGDLVTGVEVEVEDRPAKEWIYLFGFFVLGMVIFYQLLKSRHTKTPSVTGQTGA